MRRLKMLFTTLLSVFIAVDLVIGYRLWDSGWPKRTSLTADQKGIEHVQVMPIPFTGLDWLIFVLAIGVHAVLFYLLWKAWHPSPARQVSS